jgi:hypothetical protein
MNIKVMMSLAKSDAAKFGVSNCENFVEFMDDPTNSRILSDDIARTEAVIGHKLTTPTGILALIRFAHMQWYKSGLNVFDITDSLLAGLLLTTPSDEPGFPRFPFPSFVIRIPPGFVPMTMRGPYVESEKTMWLTQILVNHFDSVLPGSGETMGISVSVGGDSDLPSDTTEQIPLDAYKNTADFLKEDEARWDHLAASSDAPIYHSNTNLTLRAAIRIVANLCSWLESIGGMASQKPSNVLLNKMGNKKKLHITQWIVGREVKLEPDLLKSAKEHILGLDSRRSPAGWHLTARFPVRGHMRRQPCGKNWSERKMIWIKPFFHGPQGGDVMAHIYKAGDGKKPSKKS